MQEFGRDLIVELLAWAAGSVDAWSYFGVAHVFTANITGNTVLLGVALAGGGRQRLIGPSLAIGCYALGVIVAGLIVREEVSHGLWPKRVSYMLLSELTLLAAACWIWIAFHPAYDAPIKRTMIGIAAAALGMQSAAMQRLGIPGIVTTYITGTWTTLMDNFARLILRKPPTQAPKAKKRWEERILMQSGVFGLYCLGAAVMGLMLRFVSIAAPLVPAISVMIATLYWISRAGRRKNTAV